MTKIPVQALYDSCEMMLRDKWGYIWGTAGIEWTQSRQDATDNDMARKYGGRWIGHRVADCSGVMVYIWKQYGLAIPHGSNSIRRQSVGALSTLPRPGYAAFKVRGDDFYHIGIVGRDGAAVYEAQGTIAGFTTSPASRWDVFAPFKQVNYDEEVEPMPKEGGEKVHYRAEVTTKSGSLNMRSGPGTQYPRIGSLPRGTIVDVWMTYPDGWCYVDDDGDQGYVSGAYLTPLPPGTSVPEETETETAAPAEGRVTILRCIDNSVTIALVGEWEIYQGGD